MNTKKVQTISCAAVLANLIGEALERFQKEINTSIDNIVLNLKTFILVQLFFQLNLKWKEIIQYATKQ